MNQRSNYQTTPALIDLYVRQRVEEGQPVDFDGLATRALSHGLDGLVLFGADKPLDVRDSKSVCERTGVHFYAGVELTTEIGRLLCYPKEIDPWFLGGGWRELSDGNGGGVASYPVEAVVKAFADRGGAVVVAQPEDADQPAAIADVVWTELKGVSAIVVANQRSQMSQDNKTLRAAQDAKLACVAGCAVEAGDEGFGSVATVFSSPPMTQALLVDSLRSGRVWPVEIGYDLGADKTADDGSVAKQTSQQSAPDSRRKRTRNKRSGQDDNRGNRLELQATRVADNPFDKRQPGCDPIALLYGRDEDGQERAHRKSDEEIDRANGNRAHGADPNVMIKPDFRALRDERRHVNQLMTTIDRKQTEDSSIALRFAIANVGDAELRPAKSSRGKEKRDMSRRRGRRRRR